MSTIISVLRAQRSDCVSYSTAAVMSAVGMAAGCNCPSGVWSGSNKSCGCLGCKGSKGECIHLVKTAQLVISFGLDDGRSGSVLVPPAATTADIQRAIQTWSTTHPKVIDVLIGTTIV